MYHPNDFEVWRELGMERAIALLLQAKDVEDAARVAAL